MDCHQGRSDIKLENPKTKKFSHTMFCLLLQLGLHQVNFFRSEIEHLALTVIYFCNKKLFFLLVRVKDRIRFTNQMPLLLFCFNKLKRMCFIAFSIICFFCFTVTIKELKITVLLIAVVQNRHRTVIVCQLRLYYTYCGCFVPPLLIVQPEAARRK